MKPNKDILEFGIPEHIKQSRPGYKIEPVALNADPSTFVCCGSCKQVY